VFFTWLNGGVRKRIIPEGRFTHSDSKKTEEEEESLEGEEKN